ncbi:hypothetical protein AC579_3574 [Lecanosticta acicola]|uniref:Uncharacterized protein n=1 Tax=Lecanosticta acicola TaxID=111012 RepID=A0AAI9E8B2_9PEZI|nr:hypothetical protein AC579_3574 [Lecanosticta acicola]
MAPTHVGKKNGGRSIADFFAPFIRRSAPLTNTQSVNTDDDDVIFVSQNPQRPSSPPPKSSQSSSSHASTPRKRGRPRKGDSQTFCQTDTPRKRGRPPKCSHSSSQSSTPRKRGRPKKTESQQIRETKLYSSSVHTTRPKYNVNPLNGKADVTPTKDSPFRPASETPGRTRIAAGVAIPSPRHSLMKNDSTVQEREMGNALSKTFGRGEAEAGVSKDHNSDTLPSLVHAAEETEQEALVPGAFVHDTEERIAQTHQPNEVAPTTQEPSPPTPSRAPQCPPASYSSISTLTTGPASSATAATPSALNSSTSSRRITQDGLKGVTNSDSEDSSSDDELPFRSLQSFGMPTKRKLSVEAIEEPPAKVLKTNNRNDKKRNFFKPFAASPPKKLYKNSLKNLVAQHQKWQEEDALVASMKSAVEDAKRQDEQAKLNDDGGLVNGTALMDAAGSDSEGRERMVMALKRTDALRAKDSYHFFLDDKPSWPDAPFPVDALPDEAWSNIYKTHSARYHACTTGFAAHLAARCPLPMAVTGWMVTQLMYEQDEVLCEAYVEILRASSVHPTSISDTASRLNSIYKTRSLFEYNYVELVPRTGLPPGLKYIMEIVQFCAPMSDNIVPDALPAQTCAAFLDLALINIDERVKTNLDLSMRVSKSIERLLDALPEDAFGKLIPEAVAMIFGPSDLSAINRCRAISALPASTRRGNQLRRRLALESFSTATDRKTSDSQDWPTSILHSLSHHTTFQISESTDYSLLQEFTKVLDIAISAGWIPYAEILPGAPIGPWRKLPEPSEAEKRHNSQIDRIVKRLTGIMAKIKDAGTSHLGRVEAKVAIERLVKRLDFQVRSRVKPAKGVFSERQAELGGFAKQENITKQERPKLAVSFKDQVEVMPKEADESSEDQGSEEQVEGFQTDVRYINEVDEGKEERSLVDSGIITRSDPPI